MSLSSLNFLTLTTTKPFSLSLLQSSKPSLAFKSISIPLANPVSVSVPVSVRSVKTFAVLSEFAQDEEVYSDGESEKRFSPDLKLFVGNLPFNVDSESLAGLFERAGNVEMVEVIYDKITGRSRGFAFVTMSSAQEVEAAAQQFNGYELDGRPLRVNAGPPPERSESNFRGSKNESPFRGGSRNEYGGSRNEYGGSRNESSYGGSRNEYGGSRNESSYGGSRNESSYGGSNSPRGRPSFDNTNRLYVGNLSWNVDDSALETLFSKQGKVLDAKVVYDRDSGRSKGFGFITYGSADEVNNAIESLDGADLDGRSIRVNVAEARPPRRQF